MHPVRAPPVYTTHKHTNASLPCCQRSSSSFFRRTGRWALDCELCTGPRLSKATRSESRKNRHRNYYPAHLHTHCARASLRMINQQPKKLKIPFIKCTHSPETSVEFQNNNINNNKTKHMQQIYVASCFFRVLKSCYFELKRAPLCNFRRFACVRDFIKRAR